MSEGSSSGTLFDFDALEAALEALEGDCEGIALNDTADISDSEDTVSEVWPGEFSAADADFLATLDDQFVDHLDDNPNVFIVKETTSELTVPSLKIVAWEVIVSRCIIRSQPHLEASIAGFCLLGEVLFEEPEQHLQLEDWVCLELNRGFVLKDGKKKDPNLGTLVKRFVLENVPDESSQDVLSLLRDVWREVQTKRSSIMLRMGSTIRLLRKAFTDAVSASIMDEHHASSFDLASFESNLKRDTAKVLSEQRGGFFSQVRKTFVTPAQDIANNNRKWKHGRPTLQNTLQIDQSYVRQLLMGMRSRVLPSPEDAQLIVASACTLLAAESTLAEVALPTGASLHIVGDVHGQFWDLLHILETFGEPSATNYFVFNGDFVDRGAFSVEVALTLMALKVTAPRWVYLNRGNHEAMRMNVIYGFQLEAKQKYSAELYKLFCEAFKALPLATLVSRSVLVVHGGLSSKDGVRLEDIARLHRKREPDEQADQLMLDLLWSDPMDRIGRDRSPRGGGVLFGPDITQRFCKENGLTCIVRSHEMKQDGFAWQSQKMCLTVFSAPNYCDVCGNLGAVCNIISRGPLAKLSVDDLQIHTFKASPHPDERPEPTNPFMFH